MRAVWPRPRLPRRFSWATLSLPGVRHGGARALGRVGAAPRAASAQERAPWLLKPAGCRRRALRIRRPPAR
eukprot:5018083-Lingulodinium_polyedra.AAC.1